MERRRLTAWLVALGIVVVAFAGTVVTLNLTVYSASGFVGSYLGALARHDLSDALGAPGVTLPKSGSKALLRADALGSLDDIRLVSDSAADDGTHRLVYSYRAGGVSGKTSFTVERDGTHLGLFSAWRFAVSPASTLEITPENAGSFAANGIPLSPKTGEDKPADYVVLAPSRFSLTHHSTYLVGLRDNVLVAKPHAVTEATVEMVANSAFVKAVQKELDASLAECVKQKVLQPTGCPMGQQIDDRVQDAPTWSMVSDPKIAITPAIADGTWQVPAASGVAHLVVTVKSIFDGSISTFDKDVPFVVSYTITIGGNGALTITATY
jgi:hypothetical protein